MAKSDRASRAEATQLCPAAPGIEREYVDVEEAAAILGVSTFTVRRRVKDGGLASWQPGGVKSRILIPRDALTWKPPPPPQEVEAEVVIKRRGPQPRWMKGSARRTA